MTKKLIFITIFLALMSACATAPQIKKTAHQKPDKKYKYLNTNWTAFSYGLYYKNKAVSAKTMDERNKYLDEAIKLFQESLKTKKNKAIVYTQLGTCYYYKGYYYKSLQMINKSIELDNKNTDTYEKKYILLLRLRNYGDASEVIEDVLKLYPGKIKFQFKLAVHYFRYSRNLKKAEDNFLITAKLAEKSIYREYYLINSYKYLAQIAGKKRNIDEAITYNKKIIALRPQDVRSLYNLAMLHMQKNDYIKAEYYSKKCLKYIPYNARIHYVLAYIYYLNNSPKVLNHLEYMKNAGRSHRFLSDGLRNELLQRDDKALKSLNYLARVNPSILPLHIARAKIYHRQKKLSLAYKEYLTAGLIA